MQQGCCQFVSVFIAVITVDCEYCQWGKTSPSSGPLWGTVALWAGSERVNAAYTEKDATFLLG